MIRVFDVRGQMLGTESRHVNSGEMVGDDISLLRHRAPGIYTLTVSGAGINQSIAVYHYRTR